MPNSRVPPAPFLRLLRLVRLPAIATAAILASAALAACNGGDDGLTVYSGRSDFQVKPVIAEFTRQTGIKVSVRYGASAELAAQIAEERDRTRADVFWSQDAGALGAVEKERLLSRLPDDALGAVDPRFRSPNGMWVGISGRARVIVYNSQKVPEPTVPSSVFALTDPVWKGRVAIAPTNASFQAFVTAMRLSAGHDRTRAWLEGIKANQPKTYEGNAPIVRAVNDGHVDLGLANHYYLHELGAEIGADKLVARNRFPAAGDPGALVNAAGVAVLNATEKADDANRLVRYLLSPEAQRHFADKNFEYPLIDDVPLPPGFTPLDQIQGPNVNLADLSSLAETLSLLRQVGLL